MELIDRLRGVIREVAAEYAPDPRLAVYEIWPTSKGGLVTLEGAVSEAVALETLRERLAGLGGLERFEDNVRRLPEQDGEPIHAIVTAAAAPMLAGPRINESHVSQTVLGHHLLVLRRRGRWLQVRSEDGYIGWVHRGYVHRVDEAEARAWKIGAAGEVYISLGAELVTAAGQRLAYLPWGSRFQSDGTSGTLPNGATGTVSGEVISAAERPVRFPRSGSVLVETAHLWAKTPYLWGGITPAGADCSGFVQAVYRLHGVDLPRDSDMQARFGEPLSIRKDFSNLLAGDLLFFAELPRRVTHVAISMGGSRLIHSALGNGGVSVNDLLGRRGMEADLRRLLVSARRVSLDFVA
jgi:gamma-D-glutamyl-L-lysine dipeptidyl-peptidase